MHTELLEDLCPIKIYPPPHTPQALTSKLVRKAVPTRWTAKHGPSTPTLVNATPLPFCQTPTTNAPKKAPALCC